MVDGADLGSLTVCEVSSRSGWDLDLEQVSKFLLFSVVLLGGGVQQLKSRMHTTTSVHAEAPPLWTGWLPSTG